MYWIICYICYDLILPINLNYAPKHFWQLLDKPKRYILMTYLSPLLQIISNWWHLKDDSDTEDNAFPKRVILWLPPPTHTTWSISVIIIQYYTIRFGETSFLYAHWIKKRTIFMWSFCAGRERDKTSCVDTTAHNIKKRTILVWSFCAWRETHNE